jgi:hypothetical protein
MQALTTHLPNTVTTLPTRKQTLQATLADSLLQAQA